MAHPKKSEKALRSIEVYYELVPFEPVDTGSQDQVAEINDLDFLPIVTDEHREDQTESAEITPQEEEEFLGDIEGYSLSDFEVCFIEKDSAIDSERDRTLDFDLDDRPIRYAENYPLDDVISWLLTDNKLREIECNYQTVPFKSDAEIFDILIPEPVYYDEHETYMMGLLDDLEEMGDHREIPLLEELRREESKSFIRDRIANMIEKFAKERNRKGKKRADTENEEEELPVFSVFADLFKNIDTESKLILLDEVVAVGDEKEIEFLDRLLENSDERIRAKAQQVLKQLIAKLSHENPTATYSKGVSAIVAQQINKDEGLQKELYEGLLSEMGIATADGNVTSGETAIGFGTDNEITPPVDSDYFDIAFEPGEVFDQGHYQKLKALPPIAKKTFPRGTGLWFIGRLRKWTKLF